MKIKAMTYMLEPYISLYLVPETDEERVLLRVLWKHGHMEICNGCADRTGEGFAITQKPVDAAKEVKGE